ncbi:MAG: MlaD family protein [Pseudomonadota bacterium]
METRAHYVLIGGAVLAAIGLAFLFVLFLVGGRGDYDEYIVRFDGDANGLSRGSPVTFNGVQKGSVAEINIDRENPRIVRATIKVDKDTPVTIDTTAQLESVGFTGVSLIRLKGGTSENQLLKDVRPQPEIPVEAGGLAALLAGSGEIVGRINQILSSENAESVTEILNSVETIAAAIAENETAISETIQNTATLTENLASASERVARVLENLDTLMEEDAPATVAEARAALVDLRTLLARVQGVVDENAEPIALFADQGLSQVGPAFIEARRTLRTLDQVLREIDRNPRGYFLGGSTPEHERAKE